MGKEKAERKRTQKGQKEITKRGREKRKEIENSGRILLYE